MLQKRFSKPSIPSFDSGMRGVVTGTLLSNRNQDYRGGNLESDCRTRNADAAISALPIRVGTKIPPQAHLLVPTLLSVARKKDSVLQPWHTRRLLCRVEMSGSGMNMVVLGRETKICPEGLKVFFRPCAVNQLIALVNFRFFTDRTSYTLTAFREGRLRWPKRVIRRSVKLQIYCAVVKSFVAAKTIQRPLRHPIAHSGEAGTVISKMPQKQTERCAILYTSRLC
jgi:hypothetical protein